MQRNQKGILFSQVGYDIDRKKEILIRGPKNWLSDNAEIYIIGLDGNIKYKSKVKFLGEFWGINWWISDFSLFNEIGVYRIQLNDNNKLLLEDSGLTIGKNILFEKTARYVGPENLKRRAIFASVKPGWFDAGYLWQEVPSHSTMIVGLCDLYKFASNLLSKQDKENTLSFIKDGCIYLAMCQDKAEEEGFGKGALIHDIAKAPKSFSPYDSFMASLAWIKSAEVLKEVDKTKADEFIQRAIKSLDWIENEAKPLVNNNVLYNQGWKEGLMYPNQWMTRYLMLALWCEVLLFSFGARKRMDRIDFLTKNILKRQVTRDKAEKDFFGHFYAYDGIDITEKAWSHGMPSSGQNFYFGSDMGAVFAHPVFCFIEGIKRIPDYGYIHKWKESVENFAYNYFKPACLSSPFKILPRGVFGDEGLIWFAGVWHGTNTIYGQAAALACEFYDLFKDKEFIDIAYSNLQWICGLNAGITKENIKLGCVVFDYDIPDDIALSASMIQGVGNRCAGNWTNIRGSICNGFGTGKQFEYDVPPKKEFDSPDALHDEDWITHNGGFLMGLARLYNLNE
ncbi:MAG: hypothetical protein N3E50_05085 [Candidatus Goldbacteria bacterium]|nr:hypothetical protein [Candidatus Goldiibacteriota bacterium]